MTHGSFGPSAGNDSFAFYLVGNGCGALLIAPVEGLLSAFGVVDGVVGGFDVDAGEVVAVDGEELVFDEGGC